MKIVFVSFYRVWPPTGGASMVSWQTARHASGERVLIQLADRTSFEHASDSMEVVSIAGASDSRIAKVRGLPGWVSGMCRLVQERQPDLVVLEGASWVGYHWLLLRKLRRQMPGVPIAYHAHNVEYHLRRQKHGRVVTFLTRIAEGAVLRGVNKAFAVSSVDKEQFRKLYGVETGLLPNGVDVEVFDRVSDEQTNEMWERLGLGRKALLFMGNYLYRPNREAIDFLMRDVMPMLVQQDPEIQLVVAGGDVPYSQSWLCTPGCLPHEDLPALVRACRLGLAPIFSGSGTRLKILEYLAAGLPAVATRKGAEGLDLVDGEHLRYAEGGGEFVKLIGELLNQNRAAHEMGQTGRALVERRFSWPTAMSEFNAWIREQTDKADSNAVYPRAETGAREEESGNRIEGSAQERGVQGTSRAC